jgi:hypothetical protein
MICLSRKELTPQLDATRSEKPRVSPLFAHLFRQV